MKKIVVASNNKHKLEEFKTLLNDYEILSLNDIGFYDDIVEDGDTFEQNAKIKTDTVFEFCKQKGINASVVADDSGLCVDALGGAPGVYSARYSGDHNDEGNRQKLLKELAGKTNRDAHFACALSFKNSGHEFVVVGRCYGKITTEKLGSDRFGYDPLFFSDEIQKTFGQATPEEKDSVSHRGKAVELLKAELKKLNF